MIRQELYEWFMSIRYAIDWQKLKSDLRSRGLKRNLARFPRSILVFKVYQLLQDYAQSCLLNGVKVQGFKPHDWWFRRWEEEYGLSMRHANRKFQVPRWLLKERLELFWVSLFRIRYLIRLHFGYDPEIFNFDQSPYHHNESGSQNKATLAVRGATVPVVEGNSDVRARWTANLTTRSKFAEDVQRALASSSSAVAGVASSSSAVAAIPMPWAECMFKGSKEGPVYGRLQIYRARQRYPECFTVTMGIKGSYRETDILDFLKNT